MSYSAADVPDRWFPQNSCNGLGALIVLGDEPKARAALPCLTYDSFHRVEFTNTVRLWGGDAVSLRPRLPGIARVGYALFLRS